MLSQSEADEIRRLANERTQKSVLLAVALPGGERVNAQRNRDAAQAALDHYLTSLTENKDGKV